MRTRLRLAAAAALVASTVGGVIAAVPAQATISGYHWGYPEQRYKGTVYVASSANDAYWPQAAAIAEWDKAPTLTFHDGGSTCSSDWTVRQCILIRGKDYGDNYVIAAADTYVIDGTHYVSNCVIRVNTYYETRVSAARRMGALLHEIGHCSGLSHTTRTDSVMNNNGVFQTHLTDYDKSEVLRAYS